MKQLFKNPVFVLLLILFLGHQVGQKWLGLNMPWVDHFFDPWAGTALLASGLLLERQYRFGTRRLPALEVGALVLLVILTFEWLAPLWHHGFTADWKDIPFYVLGALSFYWWINPRPSDLPGRSE
jgi:hypothetical protein